MDLRVFNDIEKTIAKLKDGTLKPSIHLLFSKDVTQFDLLVAAAQIIAEIEAKADSPEHPRAKLLIGPPAEVETVPRVPAPAVGEVVENDIFRGRKK